MGIAIIFVILLGGLFAVAGVTAWLERHVYTAMFMAFTSIVLVGSIAIAVQS